MDRDRRATKFHTRVHYPLASFVTGLHWICIRLKVVERTGRTRGVPRVLAASLDGDFASHILRGGKKTSGHEPAVPLPAPFSLDHPEQPIETSQRPATRGLFSLSLESSHAHRPHRRSMIRSLLSPLQGQTDHRSLSQQRLGGHFPDPNPLSVRRWTRPFYFFNSVRFLISSLLRIDEISIKSTFDFTKRPLTMLPGRGARVARNLLLAIYYWQFGERICWRDSPKSFAVRSWNSVTITRRENKMQVTRGR